jgi:hypothetical protein
MTQNDILLVQSSWHKAVPARKAIAELFYLKLFQLDPAMRDMFARRYRTATRKFLQMMSATIRALDRLEALCRSCVSSGHATPCAACVTSTTPLWPPRCCGRSKSTARRLHAGDQIRVDQDLRRAVPDHA